MSEETPEIWRPYLGEFSVSTLGRVRNDRTGRIRVLTPNGWGSYLAWAIRIGGRQDIRYVHIAVLETFVGPRPPGNVARHLNGRSHDNRLTNLAWGTQSENMEDARRHGTIAQGERNAAHKLTADRVREIRASTESGAELGRRLGVSKVAISLIRRRRTWKWVDDAV